MTSRIAVILTIVASLALAACGSSDDKPTKAEYIKKADAVCKKYDDAIQAEGEKALAGNKNPTQAEIQQLQKEIVVPQLEKESDDLKALEKPEGDEDELDALYESLDGAIEKSKSGPVDEASFADANKKAKAYGLEQCGSDN